MERKILAFIALALLAGAAQAQPPYRSPFWSYDGRYQHHHDYPAVGYSVTALPTGNLFVSYGGGRYYYANETYYPQVASGAGYTVVAPPTGAETATVPPAPFPATSPQSGQAPGSAAQPAQGSWFYCESVKGYYPYVSECKEGWRQVPAAPPR